MSTENPLLNPINPILPGCTTPVVRNVYPIQASKVPESKAGGPKILVKRNAPDYVKPLPSPAKP